MRMPKKQVSDLAGRLIDTPFAPGGESGKLLVSDPDGIELLIKPL